MLGVSFDSVADNAKFARKHGFPFKLLSDPSRSMGVAYGAAPNTSVAAAKRISYLIGPDGIVRAVYEDVSVARHAAQVLADIDADERAR